MACTYTFKGKIYSEAEFNQMLSDNPNLRNEYLGGNLAIAKTEDTEDRLVSVKANNSSTIKEGVSELFESNPKLANEVYEALGFTAKPLNTLEDIPTLKKKLEEAGFNIDYRLAYKQIEESLKEGIEYVLIHDGLDGGRLSYNRKEGTIKLWFTNGLQDSNNELRIKAEKIFNGEITSQQKQQAQQQYSQYLDTIFPDSKVRDIIYRRNPRANVERFYKRERKEGYDQPGISSITKEYIDRIKDFGENLYTILVDIKNPFITTRDYDLLEIGEGTQEKGYDGIISNGGEINVYEPEQIHILGSKQDVEGFKDFVNNVKPNQLASFSSLPDGAQQKAFKAAHAFAQKGYADYANRARAFARDGATKDMVDVLTQFQINTDLAIIDLESIVGALEKDYQYSRYNLYNTNGIIAKLKEYSEMNIKDIVDNDDLRKEFTDKMRNIHVFLRSFNRISELKSETDTTGWEDIAEQLNNTIKAHQSLLADISNAQKMYDDLLYDFFIERNNSISTNPNIKSGLMDIFTATDDESTKQLWLDAMSDTNNSFIATTIKNYVREMAKAEEDTHAKLQKFRAAIVKAFHLNSVDDISLLDAAAFDKYLEKDSVGRYTGRFEQQYQYEEYYNELAIFMKSIRTYKNSNAGYAAMEKWHQENDVVDLTEQEIEDIIATKKADLSQAEYARWFDRNIFVDKITLQRTYKVSGELARPADKYLNQNWVNLQQDPLFVYLMDLMPKLMKPYIGYNIISEGFVPSRKNEEKSFSIKNYYERHLAKQPSEFIGEGNEVIRVLKLDMINKLNQEKLIPISQILSHENWDNYTIRVLMETENGGYGKFNSIDEIREENARRKEENKIKHGEAFDRDLYKVIAKFIKEATYYNHKKNIENEVTLALYKADELKFVQRKYNGQRKMNSVANRVLNRGNKEAEINLSDSNVKKHFTQWMEAIFYENFDIDQGALTAISKILLKYVSAKNMWLNYSSGLNNVAYGTTQIKIEKAAAYFVTANDLHEAEKDYWNNVTTMVADIKRETSDSLVVAMLKRFDIVESQTEKEVGAKSAWKHLISVDSLYFMQEIGEHWMQNKMLLAMLKSHRIIDGKAKSFMDYKTDTRREVLEQVLSDRELAKLDMFIEQKAEAEQYTDAKHNYIEDFLYRFVSPEKLRQYNAINKANDETFRAEFEQFDTVESAFELTNGVASVKKTTVGDIETPAIDVIALGDFIQRVKKVNQKIHGIYNKDDASLIQRGALGKLALQFRKWMLPGWNRRFGSKFYKSYWNEARQEWDKGSYVSFTNFLLTPLTKSLDGDLSEARTAGRSIGNIMSDIFKFMRNFKMYYNVLDDFEKANVRRTFTEVSYFTMTLLIGFIARALSKMGDDDDDKELSFPVNFAFYQWDRLASELGFFSPFGAINEGKKLFISPAAVTTAFGDALQVMSNAFMFVVDEEGRYYKSGIYSGELKLHINTGKMVPVYNQWLKTKRIDKMNRYYNLFFF